MSTQAEERAEEGVGPSFTSPHPIEPVMQAITLPPGVEDVEALPGDQRGDCLRACVASLFGLPLAEVPHFVAHDDWWGCLEGWLAGRNMAVTWIEGGPTVWHTPYIATGKSPRGPFKHAVIERNGDLIHDPHPSGAGLDGDRQGVYLVTPLDYRAAKGSA